jgi:hypothetical protein
MNLSSNNSIMPQNAEFINPGFETPKANLQLAIRRSCIPIHDPNRAAFVAPAGQCYTTRFATMRIRPQVDGAKTDFTIALLRFSHRLIRFEWSENRDGPMLSADTRAMRSLQ